MKTVIDIKKAPETIELRRINSETGSLMSVLRMLSNSENPNNALLEKYFDEYCMSQIKAEELRQALLARFRPENIHVNKFGVDIINGELVIFHPEVENA